MEKASPKTINLEIGTLRAILRRNRLWAAIQPDVRMLPTRDDIGRAITPEEETALLAACGQSRSRSLSPTALARHSWRGNDGAQDRAQTDLPNATADDS